MSTQPVGATEGHPWRAPVAKAAISAAVITLIATSVLAILAGQETIAFSMSLSAKHILMGGVVGGAVFTLIGLAVNCCSYCRPPSSHSASQTPYVPPVTSSENSPPPVTSVSEVTPPKTEGPKGGSSSDITGAASSGAPSAFTSTRRGGTQDLLGADLLNS